MDRDFTIATVASPTVVKEVEPAAAAEGAEGGVVEGADASKDGAEASKDAKPEEEKAKAPADKKK